MVHDFTGEEEHVVAEQADTAADSSSTETVQNNESFIQNIKNEHEAAKEAAKEDHFSRKNKFGLLTAQDIYWSFLLMEIPVIGWLLAVFWSFGLGIKRQRRELARAFLLRLLVSIILILVGLALYRWVFRLTLNDLPDLISKAYEWLWHSVAGLIEKMKK